MDTYLSFVVVGRNDNYGHKFLYRFQKFLDNLSYLCEKNKLGAELIIVDWNPPRENKKLNQVLKIPKKQHYLKIKFFVVPNKIHKKFDSSENFPLFEYVGKNLGIRKSKGKFILCTNPDIIFNYELIKYFSQKKLKEDIIYRIKRYGLGKDIPIEIKKEEIEKWCEKNYYEILGIHFNWIPLTKYTKRFFKTYYKWFIKDILKIFKIGFGKKYLWSIGGAPGDFTLISKKDWYKLKGYPEIPIQGWLDSYLISEAIGKKVELKIIGEPSRIYHQIHNFEEQKRRGNFNEDEKKHWQTIEKLSKGKQTFKKNKNWGLKGKI